MLYESKNASSTFQLVMDVILSTFKCQYAVVYMDDTVVFCKTHEDHTKALRLVLRLLRDAVVTLKLQSVPPLPTG